LNILQTSNAVRNHINWKITLSAKSVGRKISRMEANVRYFVHTTPSKYYSKAIIPSQLSNFVTF